MLSMAHLFFSLSVRSSSLVTSDNETVLHIRRIYLKLFLHSVRMFSRNPHV